MDYLLSLLSDERYQLLAQAGGLLLAPVVIIAAVLFVAGSRRHRAQSRLIDRQREEVRDDIAKLRTVIAEAISGKWGAMEEKLGGAIAKAAARMEEQQRQMAADTAATLQKQNALLESIAAAVNDNMQTLTESQRRHSAEMTSAVAALRDNTSESLTRMEQQQQQTAADNKKMTDDYGVYLHDHSAALTAAQERTLSAAAEQLRQSTAALARTEQNTAGFADRISADIDMRLGDIDKRVQAALAVFENLDNKLALLREAQEEVNRAGKDIRALSQMLTLAAAAVNGKNEQGQQ